MPGKIERSRMMVMGLKQTGTPGNKALLSQYHEAEGYKGREVCGTKRILYAEDHIIVDSEAEGPFELD
jgi:hypothetical protein